MKDGKVENMTNISLKKKLTLSQISTDFFPDIYTTRTIIPRTVVTVKYLKQSKHVTVHRQKNV